MKKIKSITSNTKNNEYSSHQIVSCGIVFTTRLNVGYGGFTFNKMIIKSEATFKDFIQQTKETTGSFIVCINMVFGTKKLNGDIYDIYITDDCQTIEEFEELTDVIYWR